MKTEWDYTILADAYLRRPDYADLAIDAMLSIVGAKKDDKCCDVGAGVAHLTLMLARRGLNIVAVEPNDAMRTNGMRRSKSFANVRWHEGIGEDTGQGAKSFDLVTFGSSFNVCDRKKGLEEAARILKPRGWFVCMWNHRQLEDPIQARIEEIIAAKVGGYSYGARREDQTAIIDSSGLFGEVIHLDSRVIHEQTIEECITAWLSHATLERQAKSEFSNIVDDIKFFLQSLDKSKIKIPYSTNIWMAQLR